MNPEDFDAAARALPRRGSRRGIAVALAALALGASSPATRAAAARCRSAKGLCRGNRDCCSGRCKKRKTAKQGTCRLNGDGGRCATSEDCRYSAFFCDRFCLDADCARCATAAQPFGFCKDDAYC